jgi:ADP-ribose pyrophosphatase YjhB (NUDIX family)
MCEPNKWIMIKPKYVDRQCIKKYSWNTKRKRNPIKCGCIIFNDSLDEVVLVENNYMYNEGIQKWGLPKGHLENNESYSICASREANEETGLSLTILDNMYRIRINNTYYFPIKINRTLQNKYLLPRDLKEIRSAKWFPLNNIDVLLNRETRLFFSKKLDSVLKVMQTV